MDNTKIEKLVKQKLKILNDSQDDVIKTFVSGAYAYLKNAVSDIETKTQNPLVETAVVVIACMFYENKSDKQQSDVLNRILTHLEYSS